MRGSWVQGAGIATVVGGLGLAALAQPPQGGPDGERRGPPSPEQFVERAMQFDADGDGKLDRSELTKLAEQMQAMRSRGGPGGPGGPGRGPGAAGRGPGSRPAPGGDGERPARPQRPE